MQLHTYAYTHHIFTYYMAHDLGPASEAGLKRPQTASDGLSRRNLSKNQYFGLKSWILALFWLQIEVYGLGGRYMASGRPRRSASSGLKRPQMTSNVLKCPQMTSILLWCPWRKVWAKTVKTVIWPWKPLYGLENRYMALKTVIWPWKPLKPLYGLKNR